MQIKELENIIKETFDLSVKDYCINGLQIGNRESKKDIKKIVTGVTLEDEFIDKAIEAKADAIFVHHGLFWNHQKHDLTGKTYEKIEKLMKHDIPLFGCHLPLDFHPVLGNNASLFKNIFKKVKADGWRLIQTATVDDPVSIFGFDPEGVERNYILETELFDALKELGIPEKLIQTTKISNKEIKTVGICTGGGQNFFNPTKYDAYITGEISLPNMIIAKENNKSFFSCDHHYSEKFGAQAFGEFLERKFKLKHEFIDIPVVF